MLSDHEVVPWFALQTRCRYESRVEEALTYKGYEVFLPTQPPPETPGRRSRMGPQPLFPGYLFCRLNVNNRLPVLIVPGVLSILGYGSVPSPVPEEEIESVRTVVQTGLEVRPHERLRAGQTITVEQGPLRGVQGTLVGSSSHSQLVVSITLLNRAVSVTLQPEWLSMQHTIQTLLPDAAAAPVYSKLAS